MGLTPLPFTLVETNAGIPILARFLESLRFPGPDIADGAVDAGGQSWYFHCVDLEDAETRRPSYSLLSLTQNLNTKRFQDPLDTYPLLRELRDRYRLSPHDQDTPTDPWWTGLHPGADRYQALMDAALILARYGKHNDSVTGRNSSPPFTEILRSQANLSDSPKPKPEAQRLLLTGLLVSPRPDLGLELLKAAGFIRELWPELAILDDVDHSKEYHPEGNVWKHTLETLRYRKTAANNRNAYDLRLSLGLLLHDVGKPLAVSSGSRRFDGHAELGARVARKFLERLEFDPLFIEDIYFLVKNHMLPAALPRLPLIRTREILESPLFPTLLELYRCDESSTFKGLDGYYESSAAYQSYLRNRRNPYRSADGKKIGKQGIRGY
ncbi:MAG: HD domain-containing protein [Treponema sp.]|jgi:poly(A) polymerase|nr:HD domain-containing protein [Treponema sp.]